MTALWAINCDDSTDRWWCNSGTHLLIVLDFIFCAAAVGVGGFSPHQSDALLLDLLRSQLTDQRRGCRWKRSGKKKKKRTEAGGKVMNLGILVLQSIQWVQRLQAFSQGPQENCEIFHTQRLTDWLTQQGGGKRKTRVIGWKPMTLKVIFCNISINPIWLDHLVDQSDLP